MKRLLFLVAIVVGFSPLMSWSQSGDFTLEQVMSAPFPTSLVAAPSGGALAWVFNERGQRNIWVASPPEYVGKALTAYEGDDGQEIADLVWTADAGAIVYVRGGAPNRQGEYPNPLSEPAGVSQEVWVVPADSGTPHRLGEGDSPAASPSHDRVAFLKGGQVWWAPLDGSSDAQQLVRSRGAANQLRWSPDGSRLAFTSQRGDHSFIGVYGWEDRSLRFLEPSVHSFLTHAHWLEAFEAAFDFFDRHLKKGAP